MDGEKLTESEPIVKSGWEPLVGAVPFRVNCRSDMLATDVLDEISDCINVVRLRVFWLIISSTRADAPPNRAEASKMFVSSGLVSRWALSENLSENCVLARFIIMECGRIGGAGAVEKDLD